MEILIDILRFIGVLFLVLMIFNLMILVHEWGHFLAGRWRGLKIDRFQIWFGKPIWKTTHNGVQYGLGTIPAGGFVSLPQMVTMESIEGQVDEEEKKALPPISPLDKIIVAFAGPLFSFFLAVAFAVLVWAVGKPVEEARGTTVIGQVAEDSPAEKAGLEVGDKILYIDGQQVKQFLGMTDSVMWAVIASKSDTLEVEIDRPGEGRMTIQVERAPLDQKEVEGPWVVRAWSYLTSRPPFRTIGVGPMVSPVIAETLPNSPAESLGLRTGDVILSVGGNVVRQPRDVVEFDWQAGQSVEVVFRRGDDTLTETIVPRIPEIPEGNTDAKIGVKFDAAGVRTIVHENPLTQVKNSFRSIFATLNAVFSPKSDIGAGHLSGPVGIMGVYYDLFQHPDGWRLVMWFSVLLNVNLAILNLLPFPVLDGGHIVMAILEWIRRKPLPIRVLEVVQTGFVLMLLGFMAFVTLKDVGDRTSRGGGAAQQEPAFLPLSESENP